MSAIEKDFEIISSTEFQKAYGRYLDESLKKPLLISTHKRTTHALISTIRPSYFSITSVCLAVTFPVYGCFGISNISVSDLII